MSYEVAAIQPSVLALQCAILLCGSLRTGSSRPQFERVSVEGERETSSSFRALLGSGRRRFGRTELIEMLSQQLDGLATIASVNRSLVYFATCLERRRRRVCWPNLSLENSRSCPNELNIVPNLMMFFVYLYGLVVGSKGIWLMIGLVDDWFIRT